MASIAFDFFRPKTFSMSACPVCTDLLKNDSQPRLAVDFKPVELLRSALDDGCTWCSVLCLALTWRRSHQSGAGSSRLIENVSRVFVYGLAGSDDTLTLELYMKTDEPKMVLELFYSGPASITTPSMPTRIGHRSSVSEHPLSENGLAWVKTRLQICAADHPSCPPAKMARLPKRVLAFANSPKGAVMVQLREDDVRETKYAALSHCWGSHQSCTTTKATLGAHKIGIPWTTIPRTFQDAIRFCLAIGIHHLWIDALCIIQDDPIDWQMEAAKMADVYQNSYVTLAATSSSSDAAGCYAQRQPTPEHTVLRGQSHHILKAREKLQHWTTPSTEASKLINPLLSRGWVFQERILSPRILHFCARELVWECNTGTRCECGSLVATQNARVAFNSILAGESQAAPSQQAPMQRIMSKLRRHLEVRPAARIRSTDMPIIWSSAGPTSNAPWPLRLSWSVLENSAQPDSSQWQRLVDEYSSLLLTKTTDRLPALSGLASRATPYLGQYLAGLWGKTLHSDLLWRVTRLEPGTPSPELSRGPSWSWASINGAVSYWTDIRTDINRHEWKEWEERKPHWMTWSVQLLGENPYGEVSSGEIVVNGFLQTASLQYVYSGGSMRELDPFKYGVLCHDKDRLELPFFADYILCEEGLYCLQDRVEVYLLLVHPDVCLVLHGLDQVRRGMQTFRRIGVIRQGYSSIYSRNNWMRGSLERKLILV